MNIKICDVCHMTIDNTTRYYHGYVWFPDHPGSTDLKYARSMDICEYCYKQLDKRAQQIHDAALNVCTCDCNEHKDDCMHPKDEETKEDEKKDDTKESTNVEGKEEGQG